MTNEKEAPDMGDAVKIASLELENVKRVRAVELTPERDGLTVIGGRNRQGKTSVLDAIAWALGGKKHQPESPTRDGAMTPAKLHVTLSNGIVVERSGKNGSLKVTDPSGRKAGQQLLDELVDEMALDLPKFMAGSDKDKADTLLRVIGVADKLADIDARLRRAYDDRHDAGVIATRKRKAAEGMPHDASAPEEPVSAAELIQEQQDILARNGAKDRLERDATAKVAAVHMAESAVEYARKHLEDAQRAMDDAKAGLVEARRASEAAKAEADAATYEPTDEIERSIAEIEDTNERVRVNQARAAAESDAESAEEEYSRLDAEVEKVRSERMALLEGADLPLDGLSVEDGALVYEGHAWSDMSGADQLKVATAIVRRVKPTCGFVLVDKLEQLDVDTLREFGAWAESEGLQVIGTRVSTGDECSVVIEDGRVAERADRSDEVTVEHEQVAKREDTKSENAPQGATWGGDEF